LEQEENKRITSSIKQSHAAGQNLPIGMVSENLGMLAQKEAFG